MLTHIILNHLKGISLKIFIKDSLDEKIEEKDRKNFEEDLLEDIKELHPNRIEGLGISLEDLESYLKDT